MAHLRCDKCGSSDTNAFGSWDTPITVLCKKCSEKETIMTMRESKAAIWAAYEKNIEKANLHHSKWMRLWTAAENLEHVKLKAECRAAAYEEKAAYEQYFDEAKRLINLYRHCVKSKGL